MCECVYANHNYGLIDLSLSEWESLCVYECVCVCVGVGILCLVCGM